MCASIASRGTPSTYLLPNTRTYGAPSACARSMKRRASSSCEARFAASISCMLAELPRSETTSPRSASCCRASASRAGASSGTRVRSIVAWSPRSSTAAKPCAAAKSSTCCHVHCGQPKVEKPSGRRPAGRGAGARVQSAASSAAVVWRNSRRVVMGRLLERMRNDAVAPRIACSGLDGKLVDGLRAILLPGVQGRRREVGLVRRIGEVLCLHREAVAVPVDYPVLPAQRAVQKVPRVELHARLRGVDLHHPAGRRLVHPRRERQGGALARRAARAALVQNEVVVVSPSVAQLLVVLRDASADGRRGTEVEGR